MSQVSILNNALIPPGGAVQTLTGNIGGPVGPNGANNIDVLGTGDVTVTGNPGTNTLTVSLSGDLAESFTTDSGVAVPVGGNLNVLGGSNINTSGVGSTVTYNLNNSVSVSGSITAGTDLQAASGSITVNTFAQIGGSITSVAGGLLLPATNGTGTAGVIKINGNRWISARGTNNAFIGQTSGNTTLSGSDNVGVGYRALTALTSSSLNVAIGSSALTNVTSGAGGNTAVGLGSTSSLVSGSYNSAFGYASGNGLTTNDSSNVCIANDGTGGDNNALRIGRAGSGIFQVNKCFIAGIDGVNVGSTATVVTESGTQLGTAVITAGTGITITPGANTITITASAGFSYTRISQADSPYNVLTTDTFIVITPTSGSTLTINLPNAGLTDKQSIIFKCITGTVPTISISGNGNTIDFSASYTMNTSQAAIEIVWDDTNTNWMVL